MHPSELKNAALTAAAKAEQDGFTSTAMAFLQLANVCAVDARQLANQTGRVRPSSEERSCSGRVEMAVVSH